MGSRESGEGGKQSTGACGDRDEKSTCVSVSRDVVYMTEYEYSISSLPLVSSRQPHVLLSSLIN